jgi:hypothetical protein
MLFFDLSTRRSSFVPEARQTLLQHFVSAIQTGRDRSHRAAENLRDSLVWQLFCISQENDDALFRRQLPDYLLNSDYALFANESVQNRVTRSTHRIEQTFDNRGNLSSTPLIIKAAIYHQPVKPGIEICIRPELLNPRQELEKCILRNVHRGGPVPGVSQSQRINLILVCREEDSEGILVAALARLDYLSVVLI